MITDVEWLHVLVRVRKQYGKTADSQGSKRDQECTCKRYGSVNNVVYETGGRIGKAAVKYGFLAVFFEFFIDLIKTL